MTPPFTPPARTAGSCATALLRAGLAALAGGALLAVPSLPARAEGLSVVGLDQVFDPTAWERISPDTTPLDPGLSRSRARGGAIGSAPLDGPGAPRPERGSSNLSPALYPRARADRMTFSRRWALDQATPDANRDPLFVYLLFLWDRNQEVEMLSSAVALPSLSPVLLLMAAEQQATLNGSVAAVPGPLPLAAALAGFVWCRRLRGRINRNRVGRAPG